MNISFMKRSHAQNVGIPISMGTAYGVGNSEGCAALGYAATCSEVSETNPSSVRESNSFAHSLKGFFSGISYRTIDKIFIALLSFILLSQYYNECFSQTYYTIGDFRYHFEYENNKKMLYVDSYWGDDEDIIVPSYVYIDGKKYKVDGVGYYRPWDENFSRKVDLKSILFPNTAYDISFKFGSINTNCRELPSVIYFPNNILYTSISLDNNSTVIYGKNVVSTYGYLSTTGSLYLYSPQPPKTDYETLDSTSPEYFYLPEASMEIYKNAKGTIDDEYPYSAWKDNWSWVYGWSRNVLPLPDRLIIPAYTQREMVSGVKYPFWWRLVDIECNEINPESVEFTTSNPDIMYEDGYIWCTAPTEGTLTVTTVDNGFVTTRDVYITSKAVSDGEFSYSFDTDSHTATVLSYIGKGKDVEIPSTVEISGEEYTVTAIGEKALAKDFINSVKLASTIKTIGTDAFASSKISVLELPPSVESVDASIFSPENLKIVVIGENLKEISRNTRSAVAKLDLLYCLAPVPPTSQYTFDASNTKIFIVPSESKNLYKESAQWKGLTGNVSNLPDAFIVPEYAEIECFPAKNYKCTFRLIDSHGEEIEVDSTDWFVTAPGLDASGEGDVISYNSGNGFITLCATSVDGKRYFCNIYLKEGDPSGVIPIVPDYYFEAPEEIYTLQGVKVNKSEDELEPGIYLIRKGSQTRKIMVR